MNTNKSRFVGQEFISNLSLYRARQLLGLQVSEIVRKYIGGSINIEDFPEDIMSLPTKGIYFLSKVAFDGTISIFIYKNL